MPPEVLLVPVVAAAACALPIGGLARPLALLAGLIVAAIAGASAWSGQGGGDPFAMALLTLIGLLFAAGAAAAGDLASPRAFAAGWSLLLAAVASTLVATDLVTFLASWESILVPLALLLWRWGGIDRRRATLRLALTWLTGSALLLTGIVALGVGARTFAFADLAGYRLAPGSQTVLALLFIAAFAVRLPLFPLHTWLPRACATAPAPLAILLCAVIPSLSVYGIARICVAFFPLAMVALGPYLSGLAAIGALYAAILATRQRDARAWIAYASLSQVQLVAAGAFSATADRGAGALLAAASHGLAIAALIVLVAALATRAGTFALAGGPATRAPVLTSLLVVALLLAIGSTGELLVLAAVFATSPAAGLAASLAVIASAAYAAMFLRAVFVGPTAAPGGDLGWRERTPVLLLLALVLVLVAAPRTVSDLADASAPATTGGRR